MSKPLHVLLSAYACLPNAGTEPGNGWNWATHLAERGIDVHVLTVEEGREPIEAYMAEHPNPRVTFSYIPVPRRFRHTSAAHYAWWQFAAVRAARRRHRARPFDIVHHVTYSSIHAPTQLWRLGVPTVFGPVGGGQTTPESLLPLLGESARAERWRTAITRRMHLSPLHRLWLRRMSLVLTTNRDTYELARKAGARRVEPWFDAALPKSFMAEGPHVYTDNGEPLRLLWIARMVPRKAFPLALDAMAEVKVPATLTIVGHGLPEETVWAMVRERGLEGRVAWSGRESDRAEVRAAFLSHDAMLFCSLRDSCPAQLVESMAMGLPVITLDHHGSRDLVPDGAGLKVPVTTPAGVARDLGAAADAFWRMTAEEKSAMSRAAWEFARQLNYADGARSFEMLYRCLLSGEDVQPALQGSAGHIRTAPGR